MENNNLQTQPTPPVLPPPKKPANKWLRLGRKILIGAIITYCVNTILLKTGWDSWEKFSAQADKFSGNMLDGALRLSPMNLYKSITTDEYTYAPDISSSWYLPRSVATGKVSLMDKIKRWFGYYWYNTEGRPFWIGRLILIVAIIAAVTMAKEKYDAERDKGAAAIAFPFIVVARFFVFLLALGLLALGFFLITKLLLAIVGGLVIIVSTLAASGGLVKNVLEELKGEAADKSKKTVASVLLPFMFRPKAK